MSNLTILNTAISQYENLFSLNNLHTISGNEDRHRPSRFIRLDQTQDLITEFEKQTNSTALKTLRGTQGGTYACKELVIAYAAWISPAFHLTVLRAFLNQVEQPQQLALPEPEKLYPAEFTAGEIHSLVWLLLSHSNMNQLLGELIEPLNAIGSNLEPKVYSQHKEYHYLIKACKPILKRLIDPFKESNAFEYERIKARFELNKI